MGLLCAMRQSAGCTTAGIVVVKRIQYRAKRAKCGAYKRLTLMMLFQTIIRVRVLVITTIVVTQAITLEVFDATQQTRILGGESVIP